MSDEQTKGFRFDMRLGVKGARAMAQETFALDKESIKVARRRGENFRKSMIIKGTLRNTDGYLGTLTIYS